MIIETIYIWIIWLILKIPQLDVKEKIDAEVYNEFATSNEKFKYSLFNSLYQNLEPKPLPRFKVMQSMNYLIVNNSTIIEYDKECMHSQSMRFQSIINQQRGSEHLPAEEKSYLHERVINISNCSISYKQQQNRLKSSDITLKSIQCKDMKVIDQFNFLQKGKVLILACRIMASIRLHILFQKNNDTNLIQLYEQQISLKELTNLFVLYQAHSSEKFILIINAKLLYFTQNKIEFYKIEQVDEIQFSEDGTQLYAMRKSIVYFVRLQISKVQLVELVDQQSKVINNRLLAYKCWKQGVLLLTDKGYLRYLEVDIKDQIHKITIYDGFGVIMIMFALVSIKVNYF
ncbi:unnamed protein product (macronuclear) [Paramecium tetraurelia]|uniref:Transmembrane protein n=1 Tax=Paramecium tetraurelia TaxID=5888 RepID=A0C881_PARTE|nr:uncharacterized protein GSPATT00036129001 [Paramecium tetraurelia]CAK66998.1 unnamed protein product [Paramecium tetraurelia]|eukprot:XP_001434395.1 hypothetical protein (macronuclear) [Paramecium tetraurelia strain d4-2]